MTIWSGRSARFSSAFDGGQEIVGDGAADAAVGEFDDVLVAAGFDAAGFQDLAVDADVAEFVDDQREAAAAGVLQQVADHRRLAGAEEAGDDGGGDFRLRGQAAGSVGGRRATTPFFSAVGRSRPGDEALRRGGVEPGGGENVGGVGVGGEVAVDVGPCAGRGEADRAGALADAEALDALDLRIVCARAFQTARRGGARPSGPRAAPAARLRRGKSGRPGCGLRRVAARMFPAARARAPAPSRLADARRPARFDPKHQTAGLLAHGASSFASPSRKRPVA